MRGGLLTVRKQLIFREVLALLVCVFALASLNASDKSDHPVPTTPQSDFSADDFDWREMVPQLAVAAVLPGEQAIKAVLENSNVLRIYVATDLLTECRQKNLCAGISNHSALNAAVTKRIDEIVQEGILHRHKSAVVDYQLSRQPFPFSEVAAVKSDNKSDAYLMLALPDHSYTAAQLQAKYGPPYDTNIFQWYSVFEYRLDGAGYASKAVFEVDPTDGGVIKVAISLKIKKSKPRH